MLVDFEKTQQLPIQWSQVGYNNPGRVVSCLMLKAFAQISGIKVTIASKEHEGIVKTVRSPRWPRGIPNANLKLVDDDPKSNLFKGFLPVPKDQVEVAEALLERLYKLSPVAARCFTLKSGDIDCLTFRLIFPNQNTPPEEIKGYYALSYRWNSGPRMANYAMSRGRSSPCAFDMAAPTSNVMFEAILDELPNEGYGLWCDQICIDEGNETERNKTVGMMDVVYKRADKVIIALDDIFIDQEEVTALKEFSDWHEHHSSQGRVPEDEDFRFMKSRPKLRGCVEKIVYSEYFDRAWCAHEFELANDRLVLIRAAGVSDAERHCVVRIPNDKLHTLMLLLSLDTKSSLSPEQINRRVNVELLVSRSDRNDPSTRSQMVHDMQTLALINSMSAGGDPSLPEELRPYSAIRDKVSILLNACELNLQPAEDLSISELPVELASAKTYQAICLLMLACGNPLVLTTTGTPIPADEEHETWLRKFWLLDAGVDAPVQKLSFPLRINVDKSNMSRWIKLNLLFPKNGGKLHTASEKYLGHALKFVKDYREIHQKEIEGEDQEAVDVRMDHMVHLIACILECEGCWNGKSSWMKKLDGSSEAWEYFFGDLIGSLPIKTRAMPGAFRRRSPSPLVSSLRSIGKRRSISVDSGREAQEQKTAMEMAGKLMSNLLLTAPMPESRGDAMAWRPAWFEIGNSGRRYIAMAPRAPGRYQVAVPEILKTAIYAELPRCWVIERKSDGPSGHWIVRNRTKLIMEGDTLEPEIEQGMWWCEKDQTVWGRTVSNITSDEDGE